MAHGERPTSLRPLGLHGVRERIRAIRRIDLQDAELASLFQRIHPLFRGYANSTPVLEPGQKLYRAVKWSEQHSTVNWLSYPSAHKITKLGRVNRPGQPMFYGSIAWNAPLFELKLNPGDRIALSRWRTTERLVVNNVGYTEKVFGRLQSDRSGTQWWQQLGLVTETPARRVLNDFFSDEFSRDVSPNNEHMYKLSVAIGEIFLQEIDEHDKIEGVTVNRMAGLVYPAMAMLGHSDNLVLKPEIVDKYLQLERAEYIEISSKDVDGKYVTFHCAHLDFANTFANGVIEWKGRPAQWNVTIPPGGRVQISVENGREVYRDENGQVIEPT